MSKVAIGAKKMALISSSIDFWISCGGGDSLAETLRERAKWELWAVPTRQDR
jgi:hypothetical protein